MQYKADIKVNLARVMLEKNINSKNLANLIGITEQNLSLLKNGKVKGIRFDTLCKICHVLECQPGDILEYIQEEIKTK